MKLPQVYIIMNKISDLSETALLKLPNNIADIRKKVNMLVIDDNEFQPEKFLIANGYQIQHKYDIDTIKDVEPYDVVLCDISGIGKKLGFTNEGASLIREIHKNYPNKRIIAYTAYTFDPGLNQFFSLADFVAPKDFGVDDWISVLDEQITESINPVNQWKKIRDYLLEINVSTIMIARIEDKYVKAVKDRNFEKLKQFVEGNDSQIRSIISDFLSSLCAKIILGIIRGA